MRAALVVVALSALAAYVNAECANACSGHGVCVTSDQCDCFPNYRAADCSERKLQSRCWRCHWHWQRTIQGVAGVTVCVGAEGCRPPRAFCASRVVHHDMDAAM